MQVRGQQAPGQTADDGDARRFGVLRGSADEGMDRLAEPGRGDAVGFHRGAPEPDHAVHRRQLGAEPGDIDPVVVERDPAAGGDPPVASLQGNGELDVDGAVAADRERIHHPREPRAQRTLGQEAHRVGARTLDASLDPHHRYLGAHVLDGHDGFADGRAQDASGLDARIEPAAAESHVGREAGDLRPAPGIAEHRDEELRGRLDCSLAIGAGFVGQAAAERDPCLADVAERRGAHEPAQCRLRHHEGPARSRSVAIRDAPSDSAASISGGPRPGARGASRSR